MASRYWVGGTANWDATVGTKWAATSGGAGGASVPTAADDVFLDAASGAVVLTIPAATTVNCRSFTTTGFTGTWAFAATTSIINIGDASGGAFTLGSGMTLTLTAVGFINFVSTSNNGGAGWTITTAGKALPNLVFNGVGGKWVQADALVTSGAYIQHTNGSWDTASFSVTTGGYQTNTGTKALTLGTTVFTTSGTSAMAGGAMITITATGFTLSAASSTLNLTQGLTTNFGGTSWGTVNISGIGTGRAMQSGGTFVNLSLAGTATATSVYQFNPTGVFPSYTVTGTFTVAGNSATQRLLVSSTALGTPVTITAATVALSNADFTDIAAAGASTPWSGTSLGNALGNSNITFPASQPRYGVVAGLWSSTATWSATSGGAGGASVPLPQDDVYLDANSAAGTYTMDMPRAGRNFDCTGFTRTITPVVAYTVYGNVVLGTGMTFTNALTGTLAGRGAQTLTTNGKAFPNSISFTAPGGSYTLQDALTTSSINSGTSVTAGTLVTNGLSITTFSFVTAGGTVTLGTSVVALASTATPWIMTAGVLNAAAATFLLTGIAATARTFAGFGQTYGTLTYTATNSMGALILTGANVIGTLNVGPSRTLTLPSSVLTTVTNWNVVGQSNPYLYLPAATTAYASSPDSAVLRVTSDIDLRVRVAMDDWTPSGIQSLLARDLGAPNRPYNLQLMNTGTLRLATSSDGTTVVTAISSVAPTIADGQTLWVRATRRQSDGRVQFFTASGALTNPVAADFTQLGTDQILSAGAAIVAGVAQVEIGAWGLGQFNQAAGKFYRAQVRNGLDGTLVFDADFTAKAFGADTLVESSTNAATVTLNGAAVVGDGRVALAASTPGTQAYLVGTGSSILSGYLTVKDIMVGVAPPWTVGGTGGNLMTADTSNLEASVGNWGNNSSVAGVNCTLALSSVQAHQGSKSMALTGTSSSAMSVPVGDTTRSVRFAVVPGTVYLYSHWLYMTASRAVFAGYVPSSTANGGDGVQMVGTNATLPTGWNRVLVLGYSTSLGFSRVSSQITPLASGEIYYVDEAMLTPASPGYAGATSVDKGNNTNWLFYDPILTSALLSLSATVSASARATASASLLLDSTATAKASVTSPASLLLSAAGSVKAAPPASASLVLAGQAVPTLSVSATGQIILSGVASGSALFTSTAALLLAATGSTSGLVSSSGQLILSGIGDPSASLPASLAALILDATGTPSISLPASGQIALSGQGTAKAQALSSAQLLLGALTSAVAKGTSSGSLDLGAVGHDTKLATALLTLDALVNNPTATIFGSANLILDAIATAVGVYLDIDICFGELRSKWNADGPRSKFVASELESKFVMSGLRKQTPSRGCN